METADYVSCEGIDKIYILHDVNSVSRGHNVRDAVIERISKKEDKVNAH